MFIKFQTHPLRNDVKYLNICNKLFIGTHLAYVGYTDRIEYSRYFYIDKSLDAYGFPTDSILNLHFDYTRAR